MFEENTQKFEEYCLLLEKFLAVEYGDNFVKVKRDNMILQAYGQTWTTQNSLMSKIKDIKVSYLLMSKETWEIGLPLLIEEYASLHTIHKKLTKEFKKLTQFKEIVLLNDFEDMLRCLKPSNFLFEDLSSIKSNYGLSELDLKEKMNEFKLKSQGK